MLKAVNMIDPVTGLFKSMQYNDKKRQGSQTWYKLRGYPGTHGQQKSRMTVDLNS